MSVISLRVYDTNGTSFLGFLPDFKAFSCNHSLNDTGSFAMTYAYDGTNASLLTSDSFRQLAVLIDGVERFRYLIEEDTWDEIGDAKRGTEFTVSGRGLAAWLSQSTVYPALGIGTTPASVSFASGNAGTIMKYFIDAAKARGCYPNLTYTFTNSLDTSGAGWATSLANIVFNAGTDVLTVLDSLVTQGLCDYRMNGNELQLYNAGATMATDKSSTVALRAGLDIAELNRKRTRRELGTAWLVQGDNDVTVDRSDSAAIATYGRIEKSMQQGGVTDIVFLGSIADTALSLRKSTKYAKTVTLIDNPIGKKPFVDFVVGDKISVDIADGNAPAVLRIQTLAASVDQPGVITYEMDLGDKFIALEEKFARQIASLASGTDVTTTPVVGSDNDGTIPSAPAAPGVSAAAYNNSNGDTYAIVTVTVTPPSTNTDGSPCTDINAIQIQWRYDDALMGGSYNPGPWNVEAPNSSNIQILRGIRPGATIDVQARAIDTSSNVSAWSAVTNNFVVANDTTAPPTPSTPTVSVKLGAIEILWDGKDNTAATQPIDYAFTEIHMSTSNGFTPTTATLVGTLIGAGSQVFVNLTYNTTYYFKLVSVDKVGNKSSASTQVSGTPVPLVRTDIGADSITYNEIAYKDAENYVEDGSFESAAVRNARAAATTNSMLSNNMTFAQTNKIHGDWYLICNGNATGTKVFDLIPVAKGFACQSGEKFYIRTYSRKDSATIASLTISFDFLLQNGTTSSTTVNVLASANATWEQKEGTVTAPANTVKCSIRLIATTLSAGSISVDAVEVRKVVQTALIDDAAITTAKINDLAVNNAKINDLSAAKITTGVMTAAITLSGSIKTGTSGARVEIDSTGIRVYNSSGSATFNAVASTGAVTIAGTLQTGLTGQRTVLGTGNNGLLFYSGWASETAPGSITSGGTGYLEIMAPSASYGASGMTFRSGSNPPYVEIYGDLVVFSDTGLSAPGDISGAKITAAPASGNALEVTGAAVINALTLSSGTIASSGDIALSPAGSTNKTTMTQIVKMTDVYNRTSASAGNMLIATAPVAELFRSTASSRRWKNSIVDIEGSEVSPSLLDLPVRAFKFNTDYLGDNDWRYDTLVPGFIAEEVAEIYPIAVEKDEEGLPMDWNIRFIVPAMLREIQRLADRVETLEQGAAHV